MATELALYVSAALEMDPECELLGQRLAKLAQSIRWSIKRTPRPHAQENPDLEALAQSHFYLILLGQDITAPIGVEWRAAQEEGATVFAYRSTERTASPAASVFAQQSGIRWRTYSEPVEFVKDFERRLIQELLEGTPGYGLTLEDIRDLSSRFEETEQSDEGNGGERRRGAGGGGVILPTDERS